MYAASGWAWAFGLAAVLIATFGAPLFAEPRTANRSSEASEPADDALLFANHPALLANCQPPNGSTNGSPDASGGGVLAFPVVPKRPNGSAPSAKGSDPERKANVLAFIREEAAVGQPVESQTAISEILRIPMSSLSELLAEMEAEGLIERRHDGRRKVITPAQREMADA